MTLYFYRFWSLIIFSTICLWIGGAILGGLKLGTHKPRAIRQYTNVVHLFPRRECAWSYFVVQPRLAQDVVKTDSSAPTHLVDPRTWYSHPNQVRGLDDIKQRLNGISPNDEMAWAKVSSLVDHFLREPPAEAIEWMFSNPVEPMFEGGYYVVGQYIGKQGYDEVSRILEKLNPDQAFAFTKGAVDGLAFVSPLQAIDLKLHTEKQTSKRLGYDNNDIYLNAVAGGKIEEAIFAAQTYLPESTQASDFAYLYAYLARTAPEKTANDLFSRSFSEKTEKIVLRSLLRQWTREPAAGGNPARLRKWLRTLEPGRRSLVQNELDKIHEER